MTDPAFRGRIASYTSISACLDHVFRAKMRLKQSLKSWYIAFFHLPLVPSLVWRLGGGTGRAGCSSPSACVRSAIPCN